MKIQKLKTETGSVKGARVCWVAKKLRQKVKVDDEGETGKKGYRETVLLTFIRTLLLSM